MITNLVVLPVIIPLLTAVFLLLWRKPSPGRRWAFAFIVLIQAVIALYQVFLATRNNVLYLPLGGWEAPVGITLTVDLLGAIMVSLCTFVTFASILYGFACDNDDSEHPLRAPLIQFLVAGVNLSFSTGDFFNLFVAFEVMLISSYALMSLEVRNNDIKHVYPYVAINLIGSTLLLCAGGLFYSMFGSLNYADIATQTAGMAGDPRLFVISVLLLCIFGLKAGIFPLYYWLPNSYPTLPAPVAALYSAMLTKVGLYTLLRVFGTLMPHTMTTVYGIIGVLAVPTMIIAILAALSRKTIRGILCFNLISHIGIMMIALAVFTQQSLAAGIFYIIHHIIVISSLFLIGGIIRSLSGSDELGRMGGLWKTAPVLGVLYLIQALSLAGVPPFSGFWGKFWIMTEALKSGHYLLVASLIIVSVITLWSLLKIWFDAFWKTAAYTAEVSETRRTSLMLTSSLLVAVSLFIGLGANKFITLADLAAARLLEAEAYADTVFTFKNIKTVEIIENAQSVNSSELPPVNEDNRR